MNKYTMLENKKMQVRQAVAVMVFAAQIVIPQSAAFASEVKPIRVGVTDMAIRQAPSSLVMLTGEELAKAKQQWKEGLNARKETLAVRYMTLSAYNSLENQTDGSPYSTAIGSLTRDGVVASNNLPIGTRVRFPDHYGDKVFRVEDRMNTRYQNNIDIWMEDYQEAIKFGRRYAKIEIVEWGKGRGVE